MKRKILVALMHPDEWNQYIPFNGYIKSIKDNYDYIISVAAENPLHLLSEADEYYTIKNSDLKHLGYPTILDSPIRTNDLFIEKCCEQILKDFPEDNLTLISWQKTKYHGGIIKSSMSTNEQYRVAFKYAQAWYDAQKLIYPTENVYNNIKQKYGHLFNDDTFIVISRNYKNKATIQNTNSIVTNFYDLLKFLTHRGLQIINIGFPPVNCQIENNYVEINEPLTQNELFSLFYLAKGVMLSASSGGFVSHYASNSDFFILADQWSLPGEFENFDVVSKKTKTVPTIHLMKYLKHIYDLKKENNFEMIYDILKNHQQQRKLVFSLEKKITFVNY